MFNKKRKGQAALEFLTTYGWAFLVILVMIGALSYFGVLNPQRFLPDKCLFGTGFGACIEQTADASDNNVLFKLKNGLGKDITFEALNPRVTTADPADCITVASPALASTWDANQLLEWEIQCTSLIEGQRVDINVEFDYKPTGGTYVKRGSGQVQVEVVP